MIKRKYKLLKRHLEKAYALLLNNDVISEKQEYAGIKIKMKSVISRLERNFLSFTKESRK